MTCMVCSLNVAPFLQRWGVAGVNSVFIVAALTMPNQKLVCCVASGLRGAEVRIVWNITDGLRCSAHVLTYAEGQINMKLHADQAEAAGQVWVRRQTCVLLCAVF